MPNQIRPVFAAHPDCHDNAAPSEYGIDPTCTHPHNFDNAHRVNGIKPETLAAVSYWNKELQEKAKLYAPISMASGPVESGFADKVLEDSFMAATKWMHECWSGPAVIVCAGMGSLIPNHEGIFSSLTDLHVVLKLRQCALELHRQNPTTTYVPLVVCFDPAFKDEDLLLLRSHHILATRAPFKAPVASPHTDYIKALLFSACVNDHHNGSDQQSRINERRDIEKWVNHAETHHRQQASDAMIPIVFFTPLLVTPARHDAYTMLRHIRDASPTGLTRVAWLESSQLLVPGPPIVLQGNFTPPPAPELPADLGGAHPGVDVSHRARISFPISHWWEGKEDLIPTWSLGFDKAALFRGIHALGEMMIDDSARAAYFAWLVNHARRTSGMPSDVASTADDRKWRVVLANHQHAAANTFGATGAAKRGFWHWDVGVAEKLHYKAKNGPQHHV